MPLIWTVLKSYSLMLHPQVLNLSLSHYMLTLTARSPSHLPHAPPPILLCHSRLLHCPHTAGPTQPSTPPLPPPPPQPTHLTFGWQQTRATTICTSCAGWGADFMVIDKKMRKGTTERRESKQQALRGTDMNIDCRWAPTGITSFGSNSQSKVLQWPQ